MDPRPEPGALLWAAEQRQTAGVSRGGRSWAGPGSHRGGGAQSEAPDAPPGPARGLSQDQLGRARWGWGGPASVLRHGPERESGEHVSSAPDCRCCAFMVAYSHTRAPPVAQMVKNPPAMQETRVQALGREDPLEKGMATRSSILAWRILVGHSHRVTKSQTGLSDQYLHPQPISSTRKALIKNV